MKRYLSLLSIFLFIKVVNAQTIDESNTNTQQVAQFVEIEPDFAGGIQAFYQFLGDHLNYPQNAIRNKIGGKVFVSFIVERDGSLTDIKILRSPSDDFSNETLRVFKTSPHWKPGIQNGKPVRRQLTMLVNFDINKFIDTTTAVINKDDKIINDTTKRTFIKVDVQPEYPGGVIAMFMFFKKNLQYPQSARKDDISGRVMVSFIVDTDGSLTNINIFKHLTPDTDQEAIRLVQIMPKWKPGMADGKPVRVRYTIPISFSL